MNNIVLCNISDAKKVVDEERNFWIQDVLLNIGVSEDIIASSLDIDEYLHHMHQHGIEIELKTNGEVLIYKKTMYRNEDGEEIDWLNPTKDNLIAHWKIPTYIRKVEGNNVYYEIHLNQWSSI